MRIVVLASSGGAAFIELKKILDACTTSVYEYFVFTDRSCGVEVYCLENHIPCERIQYTNRKEFSQKLAGKIQDIGGTDLVLLYFLRILTDDFFRKYLTLNIHPSLLPAFTGVDAVKQCFYSKTKFIGATLHLVDDGIDTGPIIGQFVTPIHHSYSEEKLNKISFLQKVYLSLLAIALLEEKQVKFNQDFSAFELDNFTAFTESANPCFANSSFIKGFDLLQQKESTQIIKFL